MAHRSLREFMAKLEAAGDLARVTAPVSPALEMTEIQTRLLAEGGPAVLFENPVAADGAPFGMPVLANLFGTVERVAAGMERTPDRLREVGETLAFLRQPEPPGGWREALDRLPLLKAAMAMRPRTVGRRALPGGRPPGRRHRPRRAARPDLLAGRAGPAHHMAAGRHAGPRRRQAGRAEPRRLPDAGDGPEHDADALAQAPGRRGGTTPGGRRRGPAPCPRPASSAPTPVRCWRP